MSPYDGRVLRQQPDKTIEAVFDSSIETDGFISIEIPGE